MLSLHGLLDLLGLPVSNPLLVLLGLLDLLSLLDLLGLLDLFSLFTYLLAWLVNLLA